jgi:predicted amidohydrolase
LQDIRVAVVQMTSRVGHPSHNIDRMEDFLADAARTQVDIVCFPELSVSGYQTRREGSDFLPQPEPVPGPSTERLADLGKRHGVTFLAGLLESDLGGIVYNTQVVIDPQGLAGSYRKSHVGTSEIGTWCQGDSAPVFDHPKARFGIEICYDSHHPELSNELASRGAEILFFPCASAGESFDEKFERWQRFMPARANDNTLFIAACNQVGDNGTDHAFPGVSFICDPVGRIIANCKDGSAEEMIVADLSATDLDEARSVPEMFFRHFKRPELYSEWQRQRR